MAIAAIYYGRSIACEASRIYKMFQETLNWGFHDLSEELIEYVVFDDPADLERDNSEGHEDHDHRGHQHPYVVHHGLPG